MTQSDMMIVGIVLLGFIAIVGVGFALSGGGAQEAARKRAKLVGQGQRVTRDGKDLDESGQRRKETQRMLTKLREEDAKRKKTLGPQDISTKLKQAGLSMSQSMFWIGSFVLGLVFAGLVFMSGADGLVMFGNEVKSRPVVVAAAGFAGFLGLPRWVLSFLGKGRAMKMTNQFADGIDIIVRGVKSGLPLTECLRIIARESPAPLGPEFASLTDSLAMGTDLERALQAFYKRVPLPEINFFVIVLSIQAKSGGNLSEALGNLSNVIRSRRMMREKVKAMSSEAKASAMIIGSLPFVVGTLIFMASPEYVMLLFTTDRGHFALFCGTLMMLSGIGVMKKMINFDM